MSEARPDFLFDEEIGSFHGEHEIHVTVDLAPMDFEIFEAVCRYLGVKPLLIENITADGKIINDYLTSSDTTTTTIEAFSEMDRIVTGLTEANMLIARQKIESVPWHPYAPSHKAGRATSQDIYFESHLGLHALGQDFDLGVLPAELPAQLLISRNARNFQESGKIIATYRRYGCHLEDFQTELAIVYKSLIERFQVDKPMIEFALYDSNVSHDQEWLDSYERAS